jgi:hypothetical protein
MKIKAGIERKAQEERQRLAAKQEAKDNFHRNVFPIEAADPYIQAAWSRWPPQIHDSQDKLDRQLRALHSAIPAFIDPSTLTGYFLPTSPSSYKEFYEASFILCSCPDYEKHGAPCKHMYRLFYELSHQPYLNPDIVNVDPSVIETFSSLSDDAKALLFKYLRYQEDLDYSGYLTDALLELLESGLLIQSDDFPYETFLNKMTKDQIILALAKKSIKGYYPSWSKYRLVAWVIETQPKFLKHHFSKYARVMYAPEVKPWAHGVCLSQRSWLQDIGADCHWTC